MKSSDYREHIIQNMSVFTEDLVNVSGIRTPDASNVLYAFLVHRRILILLCAWIIHKEHVYVLRREHLEVFPICYILIFEKVFWACQNYLEWGCYRSNQFDFPVFLLIEGVSYRVDIYPDVTMDMNKGKWTKPVMVAPRNVLILFMELKDLSKLGVVTAIVKQKQSEWKRCLNSTQHPKNPVWSSMCLGGSVPQTNGLSNACLLDDKVISHFVQILWD